MPTIDLHLVGCGNVGGSLIRLLLDRRRSIAEREGFDLRVVAISNRQGTWLDPSGLDLDHYRSARPLPIGAGAALTTASGRTQKILVDATALPSAGELYERALGLGASVVTANKLPFVGSCASFEALVNAARTGGGTLLYETTVGADLPILAPIADRRRSGDRIQRIEGSLSGTLGFLSDAVSRGEPIGSAIEQARTRGYTEPDPAEDLSGRDVARKALILARAIGLDVEPKSVECEPFPTNPERIAELLRGGRVLRYLAVIDPGLRETPVHVGPVAVDVHHPAASLRGTEAFVSLRTERCGDVPIVIRGPGAGGVVTASGLLADISRAAHHGASWSPRAARVRSVERGWMVNALAK